VTDQTDNNAYGQPETPDANQRKNEQVGESPETSAKSGESSRASMEQAQAPRAMEADDAGGAEQMQRSASPPVDGGVPSPGDSQGVAVPSVQAAAGTSEESEKVDGVKITSLAPPGKPDGEVDTRSSSTPL
jgi:hypothetical protein